MSNTQAQAAFEAVEAALNGTADPSTFETAESARIKARAAALDIITRHAGGEAIAGSKVIDALGLLASLFGYALTDEADLWDDGEDHGPQCDHFQLDEAAACARRGQIDDALHHLERALPDGFGVIAERIAAHLRTR